MKPCYMAVLLVLDRFARSRKFRELAICIGSIPELDTLLTRSSVDLLLSSAQADLISRGSLARKSIRLQTFASPPG